MQSARVPETLEIRPRHDSPLVPLLALLAVIGIARPAAAGTRDTSAAALPANLDVAREYRTVVETMWWQSPSFRRQCVRIAQARDLVVALSSDLSTKRGRTRAETVFTRRAGQLIRADISLKRLAEGFDRVELIAHEFEHIIERLDGVDVRQQAVQGTTAVWELGDRRFETQRAVEAGLRVAHEIMRAKNQGIETIAQREEVLFQTAGATAALSADGRFVAFDSRAALLPQDTNRTTDIYMLDRMTTRLTLESVTPAGAAGNSSSTRPRISGDGRFVAFESFATDLVAMTPGKPCVQIFLRDRQTGTTRLVSANARGEAGNASSLNPAISADGRVLVFDSAATNLLPLPEPEFSVRECTPRKSRPAR